ncbi:hypothetical protein LVJ82_00495 [Vitreoscilla massiliensis]|uniref:Uncharacterized protein n=1 Tax=Vitreoscilla massiliensis TaxID=1689272 RepID=A0ABY4E2L6_9NEIS|nr:hypothetical protein [Vitreoscilla massiliensis]UOO89494.1 hypothetical protein LVJ82_00495 [Vitreoscilla massiliensis]
MFEFWVKLFGLLTPVMQIVMTYILYKLIVRVDSLIDSRFFTTTERFGEVKLSDFNISQGEFQEMIGIAIGVIVQAGLRVHDYTSEVYCDDGIQTLDYTFKTTSATPELLADLQLEINRRLAEYEVEHGLSAHSVVFSVESAT